MSGGFNFSPAGGFNFGVPDASRLGSSLADLGKELGQRRAAAKIGDDLQRGDYKAAASTAFDAGDPETGLGLLKMGEAFRKTQLGEQAANDLFGGGASGGQSPLSQLGQGLYGPLVAPPQAGPDPSRAMPSFADRSGPAGSYLANVETRESAGNQYARNPNSTATGLGQFTEGTWGDLSRRRPELRLTPDGRTDPEQSRRALAAFTAENEELLGRAGLPVTDVTRYAMHFLGKGGGIRFLRGAGQDAEAPAASYADAAAVKANRGVFFNRDGSPKTARDVLADFSRSFGGGRGGGGAPALSQVAYADDEAQTQALEGRMGMVPRTRVASAEADLPMRGAQEMGGFLIPGGDERRGGFPQTATRQGQPSVNSGLPAGQDRQPDAGRVMSMPGEAPMGMPRPQAAPGGAGVAPQVASSIESLGVTQLMQKLANPYLPENTRALGLEVLKRKLDDTKLPETVREFVWARSAGMTNARSPAEYAREKAAPTVLSPGQTVYDPTTNEARFTVPERNRSNVSDDVAAREAAAAGIGLTPGSPAYQSYVLTGKMPREDAQPLTAGDKKAIQEADDQVISARTAIDNLREAKRVSKQAYEGPTAGLRAKVSSNFGSGAGLATVDLDNLVTTSALGQLKSIFGAAPTEGERKILLDIQGSSSLPDAARQRIYDRAIALAEKRMQAQQSRADELRGGSYYRQGGGAPGGGRQGDPRALPAPSPSNRPGASSPQDRFRQLTGSGMSREQAYQRLQSEGY